MGHGPIPSKAAIKGHPLQQALATHRPRLEVAIVAAFGIGAALIALGWYPADMSDVLEVRPGAVQPDKLVEFERLLDHVHAGRTAQLVAPDGTAIDLPEGIHDLLVSIVEQLKAGNGISVIPMHAELTTVEAAELLNVSRPFLIKQIEAGEIPHHMVGTHRRLRLADVLAYRDHMDTRAEEALDAMVSEAEELGLYES